MTPFYFRNVLRAVLMESDPSIFRAALRTCAVKVLGAETDDVVNFHSFRKCFVSNFERARANGAVSCSELVREHLVGRAPMNLAGQVYATKDLGRATCKRAVGEMVNLRMSWEVMDAMKGAGMPRPLSDCVAR